MRIFLAVLSTLIATLIVPAVSAQQNGVASVIVTADPEAYARQLADQMSAQGTEALRPVLLELYANQIRVPVASAQLPPQYQAQFTTMQTLIAGRRASITQKLNDVTLAGTLRSIFYYHYYGDNIWIFTRFDFVRVASGRWGVSLVLWGGDQSVVGISPTITFQPSESRAN